MIGRREFITVLGGAAAWPLAARPQQRAIPTIGYVSADRTEAIVAGFHQGLSEKGYSDGQNVEIEYRWTEGRTDRLPEFLDDLVRRQVSVIVALAGAAGAVASKAATKSIPIVFATGIDPVAAGLVASLERPGANVTGVTVLNGGAEGAKRLELLHQMVPAAKLIGYFTNPSDAVFFPVGN